LVWINECNSRGFTGLRIRVQCMWAIIPCSTNMMNIHNLWGVFIFICWIWDGYSQLRLCVLLANCIISYPTWTWGLIVIFIRGIFSFVFIGWEPTMWLANKCLQIIVCSCAVLSKCVMIILHVCCSCVIETMLLCEKWQIASLSCQRMI